MENPEITPLEKASIALTEKEQAVVRCRDNLAKLEREAEELRTVVKWLETLDRDDQPKSSTRITKAAHAADFALLLFGAHGPATIAEIQSGYEAAGNLLPGKTDADRRNILSGYLNRDARVKFHKVPGRWWYADKLYPLTLPTPSDSGLRLAVGGVTGSAITHGSAGTLTITPSTPQPITISTSVPAPFPPWPVRKP